MRRTGRRLSARGRTIVRTGIPAARRGVAGRTSLPLPQSHSTCSRPRMNIHRQNNTIHINNIMNSALDSFSRRYQNNHYYTATSLSANTTNNNNVNPSLRHETRASLETPLESSRKIGRMTSTRDAGKWRFLYCQANGMASQDVRNRKVDGITKIIEAYDINGAVFCETCVNWSTLPHNKRMKSWFDNMMEREIQVMS